MLKAGKVIVLALTYVGTIIGAGFASGQELLHFFVRFGSSGLWGTVLAGAGFVVFGAIIFKLAHNNGIGSYHTFLPYLLGGKTGGLADAWLSFYLFAGLAIMLAGCGAVFAEYLSLPAWLGVSISVLILAFGIILGEQGVLALNVLLVPAILAGVLLVVFLAWDRSGILSEPAAIGGGWAWAVSGVLYVSYNMINGMVLLVGFSGKNYREGFLGILLGGMLLGILAWLLCKVLLGNYRIVAHLEVPMVYLAGRQNDLVGLGYAVVLWLAMLTSAVVNGSTLALRLAGNYLPYPVLVVLLLVAAAVFSKLGFSTLVKTLYVLFGYFNLVVLAAALYKYLQAY